MSRPQQQIVTLSAVYEEHLSYYVVVDTPNIGEQQSGTTTLSTMLDRMIKAYRQLTGTVPLQQLWVHGFWQCKEHYHNQSEIVQAAQEFRRRSIPIDSIVQDWKYWGDLGYVLSVRKQR